MDFGTILLVGGANSIHTVRWANGLAGQGLKIHLATLKEPIEPLDASVELHLLRGSPPLGYVTAARQLNRLWRRLERCTVNVHYASGYGTLARLSRIGPSLLSVWGSDVYDFPHNSWLHRKVLIANLLASTAIGSTSNAMAREVRKLIGDQRDIYITRFGVDRGEFVPGGARECKYKDEIVIGTVKTLSHKYGIDTLVEAFAIAREKVRLVDMNRADRMRLLIAGDRPVRGPR
jgi:L-malate glycosyltransferase